MKIRKIVRRLLALAGGIIVACLAMAALNFVVHAHAIGRAELGITAEQANAVCPRTIPDAYTDKYNSQLPANDYLLYAIASNEAYYDPKLKYFLVNVYDNAFTKSEMNSGEHDGIRYQTYIRKSGTPTVLVAFRGTQPTSWRDWFANFSWITGALPVENEYAVAREVFKSIRERELADLGKGPISFVVTGHSLGGGLAQHIAAGFPCVDAVVFDASFVTNAFQFKAPFDKSITINIHDKYDELTRLRWFLFGQKDTSTYRWYPIELVSCGQIAKDEEGGPAKKTLCHAMSPFAIGMARDAVDCQIGDPSGCPIRKSDTRAQDVYCPSKDGINDELCVPVLRRLAEAASRMQAP